MSKIAIVYYSMSGNVDYVARKISENIDVDLIRIEPKKEYPDSGFKKFFWGGKSAVMKEMPLLKKYDFNNDKYDCIIFGTPVWASSFCPPIRTFINDNKEILRNKKIAVFVCYGGMGADKAIKKLKDFLEIDSFEGELVLVEPKDKENEYNLVKIKEFCDLIGERI